MQIQLSPLDEERFGIKTARAAVATPEDVTAALDFCRAHQAVFLIARCAANELPTVQQMERQGFLLMDTLLYYVRHLAKPPIPEDRNHSLIRPIRSGEEAQVREIAAQSFEGYMGHYHADPRLDKAHCDAAYISWAVRSATSREVADEVLVADVDGRLAGFATLRRNNDQEGEGVLYGVAPWAQGRGIYRSFMLQSMEWGKAQGFARMFYSTQVTNIAVQKVWVRVGAEMSHAYYTFHKWFDENPI
jgi:GNAT superfamily N-acetyltransferase